MHFKYYLVLLPALCGLLPAHAQQTAWSSLRTRTIALVQTHTVLDTLLIAPGSLELYNARNGQPIDSSSFSLQGNALHWSLPLPPAVADTPLVFVRYRIIPFALDKAVFHLDTSLIRRADDGEYIGYDFTPYSSAKALPDTKGLNYNGSFARGITFGNNQNLVLNSAFNLQMAGLLGNDIEVLAAITDNNIPLQPEGNTQQLQEFDKIFIQLKKKNNTLLAGDYEISRPNSYFMNYYKRLQGATFSNQSVLFKKGTLNTKASVAVSRGKFARNTLKPLEGNQGPYRLIGAEGEQFIIVLAGTEKVYLDGLLLKRGQDNDFTIDYNRGDITFTNKRLITKDSRVIVEFEYSDQNYLRSLIALGTEYTRNKLSLRYHFYNEQDGKSAANNSLRDSAQLLLERQALEAAGDGVDSIYIPSVSASVFYADRVLYRWADTTVYLPAFQKDSTFRILLYSKNQADTLYTASFTEVGQGQGDYVKLVTNTNGQVFGWVAPDEQGKPSGNFRPVRKVTPPNRQQLMTFGGAYKFNENTSLTAEVAMSNNDLNRLSSRGNGDNVGLAAYGAYKQRASLGNKDKGWFVQTGLNYEFTQQRFKPLNPYRNAEFSRDWNIENTNAKVSEQLGAGQIAIGKDSLAQLQYSLGVFHRDSVYNGLRHGFRLQFGKAGLKLNAEGSYLDSKGLTEKTQFFRPKIDLSQTFHRLGDWTLGVYGEREKNTRRSILADTLLSSSNYYDLYRVYVQSPEQAQYGFGVSYTKRIDYAALQQNFKNNTIAHEANVNGKWNASLNSQLNWNFTYRTLQITDTTLTTQQAQETYLGRLDYTFQAWKGAIQSNTIYELGAGQEQKIVYSYQEVPAGQGQFYWKDDNANGSIEPNEVYPAPSQDLANVLRINQLTNAFIRTNNVLFNQSLSVDPRRLWAKAMGFKKLAGLFSLQSTFQINRRTRDNADVAPWNPFQLHLPDTALVAVASSIRNILFFNRTNPRFDVQLGQGVNRNRVALLTGFDDRRSTEWFVRARWNPGPQATSLIYLSTGTLGSESDSLLNRSYDIAIRKVEPQFTWLLGPHFRSTFFYKYKDSRNRSAAAEAAKSHDFSLENTYNSATTTAIRLKLSFVQVHYSGEHNTPVEFAMLEGLQDGKNYIWNISLDRTLGQNMQFSLGYEGRKTGDLRVVHTGRAQVKAIF